MSTTSLSDVLAFIDAVKSDGAMIASIQNKLPPAPITIADGLAWVTAMSGNSEVGPLIRQSMRPVNLSGGLPDFKTLTAIQVGIFDNRQKTVRKKGETDFGVMIEAFDLNEEPSDKNRIQKFNVKLFSPDHLHSTLKRNRAAGLSGEWRDTMMAMADEMGDGFLLGPIIQMNPGFKYIDMQIVVARCAGGVPVSLQIIQGNTNSTIAVTGFATTYATGKPVPKGVMGTARIGFTTAEGISEWATQQVTL